MKTAFALVLIVAFVASAFAVYSHTDGKPDCTAKNVATGSFRNNYDPTRYWVCEKVGESPTSVPCPQETGFLDSKKSCVGWDQWVWEEPYDPPTA
ncbi:uncharacterized protein LOC129916166 [Episyrphus balteatus]|uniref:uncharacterized protein LOC129916166 n=1 Tax=Episyrphus balteatus TaxID=286459 RepID=UPI00248699C7|nr:uncharacterized protein LOC129916166 [Episyrphus balteatus]